MAKRRRLKERKRVRRLLTRAHASIGTLRAEDDPNLATYYVDTRNYLARALDFDDPAIVFRGAKGTGKSAILKMVEFRRQSDELRLVRISPDDLAFSALANVEVESPVMQSAVRNQWLFKCLWDYVLAVNLLRREHRATNTLSDLIGNLFRGDDVRQARKLLSLALNDDGSPPPNFTETMLKLVREVQVAWEAQGGRVEATARMQPLERPPQHLHLLNMVNQVAKALPRLLNHRYHVLIDDLDLHWHNEANQNALIAALFAAMARMRLSGVAKFVVAIREDIYRELPIEDKDKTRDWICDIGWDKGTLREMVEKRFRVLHNLNPSQLWQDLFPDQAFNRFIEYSHGRPRELLRHMQVAIQRACDAGHDEVTQVDVSSSVRDVSQERLEELEQEIDHFFPGFRWVVQHFAGKPAEFGLDVIRDVAETIALELEDDHRSVPHRWAADFHKDPKQFAHDLVRAGFLLVKTSRKAEPQDRCDPQFLAGLSDPWFAIRRVYAPAIGVLGT